ncbi:20043_t:CDS:2, partial [Racocetra persica]
NINESQTSSSSNKGKEKPHADSDNQLNFIEEKNVLSQIKTGEPAVQENSDNIVNSQDIDSD